MIAPLKQTDYAVTKQLFQNVFDMSEDPYFVKAWAHRHPAATVGLWVHDTLVAAAIVTSRFTDIYRLEYIFTNPTMTGKGFGTQLLQHVLDLCQNIHLTSVIDDRIHAWYSKHGFRAVSDNIFTRHSYWLRSCV